MGERKWRRRRSQDNVGVRTEEGGGEEKEEKGKSEKREEGHTFVVEFFKMVNLILVLVVAVVAWSSLVR